MQQAAEQGPVIKTRKKILTYDDYVALTPPDSGNYELHNGKIIYMASPTPRHQDVAMNLSSRMLIHANSNNLGKVYQAPLDTKFDEINTFQPDILFISKKHLSIIGKKKIEGAPDLVVEILSESNKPKEMSYKKYIYESYLVKEYWLINLEKSTVTVYQNIEGELLPLGIFSRNDLIESKVLNGFKISVKTIMEV
jgi:Uma2 family endonuclease